MDKIKDNVDKYETVRARDLKEGDLFKVDFTDELCSFNRREYGYGRTWVYINYNGQSCNISSHTFVNRLVNNGR